MTGWIKYSERMPVKNQKVIIYIDFGCQTVPCSIHDAEYTGTTFRRGNATMGAFDSKEGMGVTHWMPIPTPPEE